MAHQFAADQILRLLPTVLNRRGGTCQVLALLPYEGRAVQYRVQVTGETTQRVVNQTDLTLPLPA